MFIYQIKNIKTGQLYIGQTTKQPHVRWGQHYNSLVAGSHSNFYLQTAWNEYGENFFEFSLLDETATTIEQLNYLEEYYLNLYDNVYNIRSGGNYTPIAEETKKKISKTLSNYKKTKTHCENLSISLKGKRLSEETKKKISEVQVGRIHSNETRLKMSDSHKGLNTWTKGRKLSEETKRKMSETRKGKKLTEETKKKISLAKKRNNSVS